VELDFYGPLIFLRNDNLTMSRKFGSSTYATEGKGGQLSNKAGSYSCRLLPRLCNIKGKDVKPREDFYPKGGEKRKAETKAKSPLFRNVACATLP